MKVLFVQKVKALVGSEKYFLELIPELEKRRIKTTFICIYSKADIDQTSLFIEAFAKLGTELHTCEIPSEKAILKSVRFIRKIEKEGNFDLIHSHLIHADFWCALLKKVYRVKTPLVSTKHGYDEAYIAQHGFNANHLIKNRYFRLCKYSEKYISKSFAVSEGLKQFFIAAGISDENKISTIHHGFDLPELNENKRAVLRKSPHQLLILGRIIPFKGHRYLLESLVAIKKEIPDVHLNIVGHGDEDLITELKKFTAREDLEDNISFEGYQTGIYSYLQNTDLMVVPSISEGFGLIFLEAMNANVPIVGFDVPATNEIIINQKTGVLVELRDTDALAAEIIALMQDSVKRQKYATAAHDRLKDYFSLDRMVSQTIQFYQSAL